MDKTPRYDSRSFDGLSLKNYSFKGTVEIEIVNVDIDTDRGTKWETDIKVTEVDIELCYDELRDLDIEPEPWMDDLIKEYYESNYEE